MNDDALAPLQSIYSPKPEQPETPPKRRRWVMRLAWALGVLLLIGVAIYALDPISWALESFLVHESTMLPAQAALVFNLGETNRAAELLRNGTVQRIFIARGPMTRFENADPPISEHIFIQQSLIEAGVPEEVIDALPRQPENMLEEQQMLRDWMLSESVGSFIQFTPYYHSGFWKLRHENTFAGLGIEAIIQPIRMERPIWRKQALALQNLLIRMAYWRIAYKPIVQQEAEHLTPVGQEPDSACLPSPSFLAIHSLANPTSIVS